MLLCGAAARRFVVDWEARTRRLLAEFRADTAGRADDAILAGLIEELRAGNTCFGRWWDEQQVMGREGDERSFNLADGSMVRLHQLTLTPASDAGCYLVVLLDPKISPECRSDVWKPGFGLQPLEAKVNHHRHGQIRLSG